MPVDSVGIEDQAPMISVQVVGITSTGTHAETVAQAKTKALALARIYPQHWVHALNEDGSLVHLIEPRSIVDDSDPEEPVEALPDQEGLF